MLYLLESTYPGTKVEEAAKLFIERMKVNPMPACVKIRDLYAYAGGEGFKVLLFYEIEDGKEKEGTDWISRGAVAFLRTIEGYKLVGRIVYSMEEAFQFLEMQAPEA